MRIDSNHYGEIHMTDIAEYLVSRSNSEEVEKKGVERKVYELLYKGKPPWEIGKPQPAVIDLEQEKNFISPILDVGCGGGANAKYLAERGYQVYAIDYIESVISKANIQNPHSNITFAYKNVFDLENDIKEYQTILDSATFHGFSDKQRKTYADTLRKYMKIGAYIFILGFSEKEIKKGGPRRLSAEIFKNYFKNGFEIEFIKDIEYLTTIFDGSVKGIVAKIKRI